MATLPDIAEQPRPIPRDGSTVAGYSPQRSDTGSMISGGGRELAVAGDIVADTNARQDQVIVDSALNQLRQRALLLEQDPNAGFRNVKGSGAVAKDFVSSYQDRFKGAASEIENSLANENQKSRFKQLMPVTALSFQSNLLQHQAKETIGFNRQTREDTLTLGMNDIAAHPYDDATYDRQSVLMGQAVVANGKEIGLDGEALANYVRVHASQLQSKALAYRTASMLQDDPVKAAKFFHDNELDFDPQSRIQIGGAIKTALDARGTKAIGELAVTAAATTAGPAIPQNFNADFVRPYSMERIDSIKQQLDKPSQYDALFNKYADLYNISPKELKLRAIVESGLNPSAESKDRGGNVLARGLMQFAPETAKKYNIDPMNPEHAIAAAATLIAQAGGTLGGDMSKVDRTYYGGGPFVKGPNTDQYVENYRALRQAVFGASPAPQTLASLESAEGAVTETAKAMAQRERPGDPVYEANAVQEARKNLSQAISIKRGEEYANYSSILGVSVGPSAVKAMSELSPEQQQQFAKLTPEKQHSLFNLWKSNANEGAIENPQNTREYLALMGQAMTDPVAFKNRDIAEAIKTLPKSFQAHVLSTYTNIDKEAAKGANYSRVLNDPQVASMVAAAGVKKPVAGKTSESDNQDYEAMAGMVMQSVDSFVEEKKRQPTPKEYLGIVAPVLADVKVNAGWMGGSWWPDTKKAFQLRPGDVPIASAPATPKTADDFAKLPKGARFVNPADGRLMVKN